MRAWLAILGVVCVVVLILLLGIPDTYNKLVSLDERVSERMAVVRTNEQRRYDLIPNLVKTVEASANFERETLTEVTGLRSRIGQILQVDAEKFANDSALQQEFLKLQQQMGGALSRLLVTVEAYPDLKSTQVLY